MADEQVRLRNAEQYINQALHLLHLAAIEGLGISVKDISAGSLKIALSNESMQLEKIYLAVREKLYCGGSMGA